MSVLEHFQFVVGNFHRQFQQIGETVLFAFQVVLAERVAALYGFAQSFRFEEVIVAVDLDVFEFGKGAFEMIAEFVVLLDEGPNRFEKRVVGFLLGVFGDSKLLFKLTGHQIQVIQIFNFMFFL